MKKILLFVLILVSYMLCGCNKSSNTDTIDGVLGYVDSLDSYTYTSDMVLKRNSKEMKINLEVAYKKLCYCISLKSDKLDKQFIVKNSTGVYVLTPKADKKFEFNSEWPLNSSHAYMLSSLANDIKNDKNATISVKNGIATIRALASSKTNANVKSLVFEFDTQKKLPLKACFKNAEDEAVIEVKFTSFVANPVVSDDKFNVDLIMRDNQNETTSPVDDKALALACSNVLENATLSSKSIIKDCQILCYSASDKRYTIVAKEVMNNQFEGVYKFNDYVETYNGLLMYDSNRVYMLNNNIDISVYSTSLNNDELYDIISGIELV